MQSEDDDRAFSLPYGRHEIDDQDLAAVSRVLLSNWLTTGPEVEAFEQAVARVAGVPFAAAVSSGTAALHASMAAVGIEPGDEVILPPMTFAATANAVVYQGGTPVFADVDPGTLLIDPDQVEKRISSRTRAVIAVDYAGQMCDYDRLAAIARPRGISLVADACHSIGGSLGGNPSGSYADLTVFSFHPVKHITTGEGGMVVSGREDLIHKVKRFRNHGISADSHQRRDRETWYYEIETPGYNYRLTDFQCALGLSQLKKLDAWVRRRNEIARQYDVLLAGIEGVSPLETAPDVSHARHLYVVRLATSSLSMTRGEIFSHLRSRGIGVNVHYIPVHFHPFYQKRFHLSKGLCPVAEQAYEQILTLPLFPAMTPGDVETVCRILKETLHP